MRRLLGLAAASLSVALTAAPVQASPPPGTATVSPPASFHFAGALAAPQILRLSGFNGSIAVSASADDKADVRAIVREGDPSHVRVVARAESGGVAVCVFFEDESPDGCKVSGAERPSTPARDHQNGPSIDLVARLPAGVSLVAGTLNGAIHANGLTGEVRASTLNGDVDVSASSVPEATTLNGNVHVSFATPPTGRVSLSTNNGDVTANLPSTVDADVEASTIHGEIMTTFPMTIESTPGGFGPKTGRTRLGKGGARIQARSINGNVNLRTGA